MSEPLFNNSERWLAAELALGVLTGARLKLAQGKFESNSAFKQAVEDWQEQLSPMLDEIKSEPPSPHVWQNIVAQLFVEKAQHVHAPKQRTTQSWYPLTLAASIAFVIGLVPYWINTQTTEELSSHSVELAILLDNKRSELAKQETELGSVHTDLKAQQQTIVELEVSIDNYRNKLSETQADLATRERQLADTQQNMILERTTRQTTERAINKLKQELLVIRAGYENSQVQVQRLQSELEKQRITYAANIKRVSDLETTLALRETTIQTLSTPGLAFAALSPTSDDIFAQGHVLWNKRTGEWLFYTFNLPELHENKTYQMWFITDKEGPLSAGIFKIDSQGRGVLFAQSPPASAGNITATAVSLEPAGGVNKPTGPIYVQGVL